MRLSLAILSLALLPASAMATVAVDRGRPIVITKPGYYALHRDLNVNRGDAVTILACNVTFDLNGHSITTDDVGKGIGVWVKGQTGVIIKGCGRVSGFNVNIQADDSENVVVKDLQISGNNLPAPPPAEIGILLINTRGSVLSHNTITSVNLGIFVRGASAGGNRISDNTITGGKNTSRNLLGMCWNPAPGGMATDPGPRGDLVYNNHVSLFQTGIAFSSGSVGNIIQENFIAYVASAFSPSTSTTLNVVTDNTTIQVTP